MSIPCPRSVRLMLLPTLFLCTAMTLPSLAVQDVYKKTTIGGLQYGDDKRCFSQFPNGEEPPALLAEAPHTSPSLSGLYRAVEGRSYSDCLTIAVLQGSKEGVVVNMFPPGNDGSRTDTGGGTGSGDVYTKNLPKEGQVISMFPPGNDGSRKDNDPDPIPGIDIIVECCPGCKASYAQYSEDVCTCPSGAQDHNTTRSNRHTRLDPADESGNGMNQPSTRFAVSGDTKQAVVQCEGCGATCTEPCRCRPHGGDLIWGKSDDQLRILQMQKDYAYLTFQTSYGMRSVTVISVAKERTLVIAKGWYHSGRDSTGKCSNGVKDLDLNPYAEVGIAHNRTLDYLTPDVDLRLPGVFENPDKIVRKKPGRTTYANITPDPGASLDAASLLMHSQLFFNWIYDVPPRKALTSKEMADEICRCGRDGYGSLDRFQKSLPEKSPVRSAIQELQTSMLLSPDLKSFYRDIDRQVENVLRSRELSIDEGTMLLGALALAKGTMTYWNAQDDIFIGDIIVRGNGKFWADVAGFIVGAGAELISDGDPADVVTTGASAASAASALYEAY